VSAIEERLHRLIVLGISGDSAAYRAFLKEVSPFLRAFLRRRLVQLPDEVEDLVQETLLAVHNQRHTYDAARPITAWVHGIARYKLADMLRRRSGREAMNDPWDDDAVFVGDSGHEATDARRDLGKLLAELPERQRLPIKYVKLDGLSVAEAARLTGMTESAVKVGVHRGLRALMAKIKDTK
jgi:RNA polymerase sigma-70 factor (ECF subfamily)